VFSLWKFLLSTFNHLFIRTYVSVDYAPPTLSAIVENLNEEANQLNEIKNRIGLVWSLAILDQANQQHTFYYRHIFHFLVFACPLPFFLLTLRLTLLGNKIKEKNLNLILTLLKSTKKNFYIKEKKIYFGLDLISCCINIIL